MKLTTIVVLSISALAAVSTVAALLATLALLAAWTYAGRSQDRLAHEREESRRMALAAFDETTREAKLRDYPRGRFVERLDEIDGIVIAWVNHEFPSLPTESRLELLDAVDAYSAACGYGPPIEIRIENAEGDSRRIGEYDPISGFAPD